MLTRNRIHYLHSAMRVIDFLVIHTVVIIIIIILLYYYQLTRAT